MHNLLSEKIWVNLLINDLNVFERFRFHTAFLDQIPSATGKKKYKLKLNREEIDNPHKSKTWNTYREDFAIEMLFTEVD